MRKKIGGGPNFPRVIHPCPLRGSSPLAVLLLLFLSAPAPTTPPYPAPVCYSPALYLPSPCTCVLCLCCRLTDCVIVCWIGEQVHGVHGTPPRSVPLLQPAAELRQTVSHACTLNLFHGFGYLSSLDVLCMPIIVIPAARVGGQAWCIVADRLVICAASAPAIVAAPEGALCDVLATGRWGRWGIRGGGII
jgi:hypothetical protein